MKAFLLVAAGGALGSAARYAAGAFFLHSFPSAKFPWGTFFVNIAGCLAIGLAAGWIEKLSAWNAETRLAVVTGFLGGFTTFSAFGLDTLMLIKAGDLVLAVLYAASSVILGVLMVQAGLKWMI